MSARKGDKHKSTRKVDAALVEVHGSVKALNEMILRMSDRQRLLFMGLAKGYDSLKALYDVGLEREITGIVKIVYDQDMKPVEIAKVKFKDLDNLDDASYQRLLRLAETRTKEILKNFDPGEYVMDIQQVLKLAAYDAFGKVLELSQGAKSEKVQLTASKDILDRAGFRTDEKPQGAAPIMIQINTGGTPQAEVNPVKVWQKND